MYRNDGNNIITITSATNDNVNGSRITIEVIISSTRDI